MTSIVGVDVGGSHVKAVLLGEGSTVLAQEIFPQPGDPDGALAVISTLVGEMRRPDTAALGVGVAGLVRWPEGKFVWGPHLPWTEIAIRESLETSSGLVVTIDNDANCAALAELLLGAARGATSCLVIILGTGIGAGLIVDGALYRGASFAGEVGHMTMVPGGIQCVCGRLGCWETLVSGRLIDRALKLALAGDHAAAGDLVALGRALGRGLVDLVLAFDPSLIVVGGGAVDAAGDLVIEPAQQVLAEELKPVGRRSPPPVVLAELGPWSGAIGAALNAVVTPTAKEGAQSMASKGTAQA